MQTKNKTTDHCIAGFQRLAFGPKQLDPSKNQASRTDL